MTDDSRYDVEVMELLNAIWDDRADARTYARLEELLAQGDRSGVDVLRRFSELHLELERYVSSRNAWQRSSEALAFHRSGVASPAIAPKRRKILAGSFGIAACLAAASVAFWLFGIGRTARVREVAENPATTEPISLVRSPLEVARVARIAGAAWGGHMNLSAGSPLLEGQAIELVEGEAQISMGLGADAVLFSPCKVTLLSDSLLRVDEGSVAVQAAKWATGFSVVTSNGLHITDLGTRFLVSAQANGVSEAEVLEGSVLAKSLNEAAPRRPDLLLNARKVARLGQTGVISELESTDERRATVRFEHFQPLRPIEIWNTGVGCQVGDGDANWNITSGDERVGRFPQPATVCPPFPIYRDNDPLKSQWISVDGGTTDGVPAWTDYVFETTFDLTGFDPESVRISGLVLADNGVRGVRLNGKLLAIEPWDDWYVGVTYYKFHRIEIHGGFVSGMNRIEFLVNNNTYISKSDRGVEKPDTPNPMGLRVEWRAYGRPTEVHDSANLRRESRPAS